MASGLADAIGTKLSSITTTLDREKLVAFATSIGETNLAYLNVEAARRAGYPDVPALPTYLYSVGLQGPDPLSFLNELGIDSAGVMHGTQTFSYARMVFAGERVTMRRSLVNVYEKKQGALEFLEFECPIFDQSDVQIAMLDTTFIIRH